MYTTQVETATLPVSRWLSEYRFPARFRDACKACPDYGRVWSCPPGVPEAEAFFSPFSDVTLIAVRVIYSEETRRAAASPEETEQLRKRCYGTVKKQLLATQLALEKQFPGTLSIAAGRCEQCERCTRPEGAPCRMPDRLRYSFSAFGFDLGKLALEQLSIRLLWSMEGLPEYDTAMAAFFAPLISISPCRGLPPCITYLSKLFDTSHAAKAERCRASAAASGRTSCIACPILTEPNNGL